MPFIYTWISKFAVSRAYMLKRDPITSMQRHRTDSPWGLLDLLSSLLYTLPSAREEAERLTANGPVPPGQWGAVRRAERAGGRSPCHVPGSLSAAVSSFVSGQKVTVVLRVTCSTDSSSFPVLSLSPRALSPGVLAVLTATSLGPPCYPLWRPWSLPALCS